MRGFHQALQLVGRYQGDITARTATHHHDIPVGDELAKMLGQGAAVMMRGHGMVVVGDSIQSSVGRAVGLDVGAQEQIDLLSMGGKVTYLTAPADAAKNFGNYAREWSWWTQQIQAR